MFSITNGAVIRGVNIFNVTVETDVSEGLPVLDMVGLLNSEVKEAKERVRTAIKNTGIHIPPKRITINLSPADMRKEGGYFDLPIAIGILQSLGMIKSTINIEETLFVGELGLNGELKRVRGALAIAAAAGEYGYKNLILPWDNAIEAAVVGNVKIYGMRNLREVIDYLKGDVMPDVVKAEMGEMIERNSDYSRGQDFSDVNGQEGLKRAAMVAAAGRHNILLVGPPGSGKTMVSGRISTILPKPDIEECIEITKIYSIAGELRGKSLITERPFRSPHHTITVAAMSGGGNNVRPGEITLAHKGVLFLDELAEYRREVLETLRQPLESGEIVIDRSSGSYVFPADIMVVAATNPCKCGYYPDRNKCKCTEYEVKKYMGRISGPIINRMDIMVSAPLLSVDDMQKNRVNISSQEMRKKVEAARLIQCERYKGTEIQYNSRLSPKNIKKYCYLGEKEKRILRLAFEDQGVSARTYYKVIKVARTIADIENSVNITENHIAEALGYRPALI